MESVIATLSAWAQNLSTWLQMTTGLSNKDLALFAGGILMVFAVLWLGLYSGKPRYREAARFGWWLLILAGAMVAWGLYNHNPRGG